MASFFKKTRYVDDDGDRFWIFNPTIRKTGKGIVKVPDSFRRKQRENKGGLDSTFVVPIRR